MKIELNLDMLDGFEEPSKIERCACLLGERVRGGWMIDAIAEVPNRHPVPQMHYRIMSKDPVELLGMRRSKRVIGVLHTHPLLEFPEPSDHDIDLIPKDFLGMVYHPPTGLVTFFNNQGLWQQTTYHSGVNA